MRISVLIPAYKENRTIGRCLNSIIKQSLPKHKIEIIVSSPDELTRDVVKKYQKKYKNVRLVKDEGRGKPAALNLLFKNSKGDILILTDADVILGKNSISNLLKHFRNKKVGGVCGKVTYRISKDSLFYEWAKFSERFYDKLRRNESKKGFCHLTGNLCALRKGIIDKVPENSLSDDAVIGYLINSKKYLIKYEPKAKVFVKYPLTCMEFIKQKSRTRAGFLQMKRWFNLKQKRFFELSFGLRDFLKFFGMNKLHKMILTGLIYFLSWFNAYLIFLRKKKLKEVWVRAESTKY